jgi:hypothetical protein
MSEQMSVSNGITTSTNPSQALPSWVVVILLFLLFSGPPMFRIRDPTASLDNEIDIVIVMQVSVWLLAGLWLAIYLRQRENRNALHWGKLQTLSLIFIGILGLSTISSVAPSLTAFKVFQMFVSMMFTLVFVERYGIEQCLEKLFWFSFVLCVAVGILAIVAPDLVNDVT